MFFTLNEKKMLTKNTTIVGAKALLLTHEIILKIKRATMILSFPSVNVAIKNDSIPNYSFVNNDT